MRAFATGLLVLMVVLIVVAHVLQTRWPWMGYLRAFAEAGAVGACADWFAVTALFRRPFGLPIPHTAIIARNKDRIGEALGSFIAGEFLAPRVLDQKVREVDPARHLAEWVGNPDNAADVARLAAGVIPDILASGPELKTFAGDALRRVAETTPAGPTASRILAFVWRDGRSQRWIDELAARAAQYLSDQKDFIAEQMADRFPAWLPRFVDKFLAERFAEGLAKALEEMRDPDHPWRQESRQLVERLIHRLAHDPETIEQAETWKRQVLDNPAFQRQLEAIWNDLEARLASDPEMRVRTVSVAVERGLMALGRWLREDDAARQRLNGWIRIFVRRALSPRRREIGEFVAGVVRSWDARDVVEKLELQVGRDLQYIRINGTVVGGLVGLAVYAISQAALQF
jgi:uncharacterized membrane-anchored protein YjiN (DUF445 family)